MFEGLKGMFIRWLGIVPPMDTVLNVTIRENITRDINTLKNQLWYRGDPVELEQFYKQLAGFQISGYNTGIISSKFWASTPTGNQLIRKLHSGLPRMIVDRLAGIVVEDMLEPTMDVGLKSRWDAIVEDEFDELIKKAVAKTLSEGDGAFKINIDTDISDKPLIEFYSGNKVEFVRKRGKLVEIIYYTDYFTDTQQYRLAEHYGRGYVNYKLLDFNGKECPLDKVEETKELLNVTFDGEFIMGVPFKVFDSAKWEGRGEAILEVKGDMFDAFDEVISTWMDALRAGRVKQYIPESLVPRNPETGEPITPDVFNPYIIKGDNLQEDATNEIDIKQGEVDYEGYVTSYSTLLDSCLQGIISPSTLGIDLKKTDNAESQREKEKATLYTRDEIIGALAKALPKLVDVVLKAEDNMNKTAPPDKYEATFEWGQYASPSFDTMVETVGKAKTYGIMSIEKCVDELYGDSMSEREKEEEVARLKEESKPPVEFGNGDVNDTLNGGDEDGEEE